MIVKISVFFVEEKLLEARRNFFCRSFESPHIVVGEEGMQKCSVPVVHNKGIRFWIRERIHKREEEEAETE
jgi:hypothetical protein